MVVVELKAGERGVSAAGYYIEMPGGLDGPFSEEVAYARYRQLLARDRLRSYRRENPKEETVDLPTEHCFKP